MLTGGSGDVSPQLMTLPILTTSAVNTATEIAVPLPVARMRGGTSKRVTVIEVLRVYFDMPNVDTFTGPGNTFIRVTAVLQLSSSSLGTIMPQHPNVFAYSVNNTVNFVGTGASTFHAFHNDPFERNLTDEAGHGFLLATDNLFACIGTTNFTGVAAGIIKILYRFKDVGLEEYLGIVQGQQG